MANRKFWDSNRNPITWHKINSAKEKAYLNNKLTADDFDTHRDRNTNYRPNTEDLEWS